MLPRASILVIDTDSAIRELFADILAGEYTVSTASEQPDILNLVTMRQFDLLFVDLRYPSLEGLDLVRLLRAQSGLVHTPSS